MKILVPIKRVPDPEQKVKLAGDDLDLSAANWIINPFDEYAVETALRLTENADTGDRDGEVVVVSIAPEDATTEIRKALAMGADRAIRVEAADSDIDSTTVVDVLAKIYEEESPNLVILGKQAVDGDASQVGQMLAGKLGLPQATFAASVDLAADKTSVKVGREVDNGVEYKSFATPGIVSVDLRSVGPKAIVNNVTPADYEYQDGARYPSVKGIMKAKKKPMDVKSFDDLGVSPAPKVKQLSVELPASRAAGQKVETVAELVDKLKNEARAL